MKSQRNNFSPQMMPFPQNGMMPTNMMMFPNYMNDNYTNLDNRISSLEKKVKVLENRISRLETPYQNTNTQSFQNTVTSSGNGMPFQTTNSSSAYQTTQSNTGYDGEMYMM